MATVELMSNVVQMRRRVPAWTFGERVRKARREVGLTQGDFAAELGVSRQAYAAWETGRNTPTRIADVAQRLEEVTGFAREWFLGWADGGNGPVGPDGFEPSRSTVKVGRFGTARSYGAPAMRGLAAAS